MFNDLLDLLLEKNSFSDSIKFTENGYLLTLHVPGYGKEDFTIELDGNLLTIKAEGLTTKKYELPADVKNISAKCDKGILQIHLYKSKKDKKIIKVG